MASTDSLEALLEEELKDIYDAEKQLTKALPKLAKKATSPELKEALLDHLRQTEEQIGRIEQIFEQLELPMRGKKCVGMQNLLKEGQEMISEAEDDATRDAVMIASAQKVEHYEIASYGTARTWATVLGRDEIASLLEETLEEEKEADGKLTAIAESYVNRQAADEGEEDDEVQSRGRAVQVRGGAARRPIAADRGRKSTRAKPRSR
jgi:ferritin-like metal-binding protein YciE